MVFLTVGLPSRFAEWCDGVCCALVQAALGPYELASGNTLEEIAQAALKTRASRLVIGARQPTEDLRGALLETGRRFVVALDDPRAAFYNLVARHGIAAIHATRAAAGSCAAMLTYAVLPNALVLRAEREGRDPAAAAAAIARWFGIEIEDAAIEAVVQGQAHAAPEAIAEQHALDLWWGNMGGADQALAEGTLNGYVDYFARGTMGPMIWTRELFFLGDEPGSAATRTVEIRGPSRTLVYGPYLTLPPGSWAATVVLAVAKGAANVNYIVEILAGERCLCLGRGTIEPRGEGLCEVTIEFGVSETTDQPIALRVINLSPASDGRLALVHVVLSPRLKARPELLVELATALGW
ncbi:MAG: hypothetical protein JO267_13385 [Alphaproteobacteria bacterium]|nr:hypothetical protein [Alphaproteobacteria bacterium]